MIIFITGEAIIIILSAMGINVKYATLVIKVIKLAI